MNRELSAFIYSLCLLSTPCFAGIDDGVFFTASPDLPLKHELRVVAANTKSYSQECELIFEANISQQSETEPSASLIKHTISVPPMQQEAPTTLIGAQTLIDLGIPGLSYHSAKVIFQRCTPLVPDFRSDASIPDSVKSIMQDGRIWPVYGSDKAFVVSYDDMEIIKDVNDKPKVKVLFSKEHASISVEAEPVFTKITKERIQALRERGYTVVSPGFEDFAQPEAAFYWLAPHTINVKRNGRALAIEVSIERDGLVDFAKGIQEELNFFVPYSFQVYDEFQSAVSPWSQFLLIRFSPCSADFGGLVLNLDTQQTGCPR